MKEDVLKVKSFAFALRIVKLCKYLRKEQKEYILSKQILRSGTAIGALVSEAKFGQSKADFVSKMSIALKEANETDYWLRLLKEGEYIEEKMFKSLYFDLNELISLLVSTVKTSKGTKG